MPGGTQNVFVYIFLCKFLHLDILVPLHFITFLFFYQSFSRWSKSKRLFLLSNERVYSFKSVFTTTTRDTYPNFVFVVC